MSSNIFVFVLVVTFCSTVCSLNLNNFLNIIPKEDRINFLKYHAERGYSLENTKSSADYQLDLSDEFSVILYRLLSENSVDMSALTLTKNSKSCIVCFPNGKCVDLCDPGVHPV